MKEVKVKKDVATVTFTSLSVSFMELKLLFVLSL